MRRRQSCWQPRSMRCWGWTCNGRRGKVRFSATTSLHGKVMFITGGAQVNRRTAGLSATRYKGAKLALIDLDKV